MYFPVNASKMKIFRLPSRTTTISLSLEVAERELRGIVAGPLSRINLVSGEGSLCCFTIWPSSRSRIVKAKTPARIAPLLSSRFSKLK